MTAATPASATFAPGSHQSRARGFIHRPGIWFQAAQLDHERHVGFIQFQQRPPEQQHDRERAVIRPHRMHVVAQNGNHGAGLVAEYGAEQDAGAG